MAALSTYGADAFLDGTALPATLYIQWHIGDPGAAGTANPAAETTRRGFTRTAAAAAAANPAADITVASPAASETWTHATLWDAAAAGNCWMVAPFAAAASIIAGVGVVVPAAAIDLTATVYA